MQLGDWVEFETIVVKQPTANGNKPATTRLARKRRGQVVGERHVYEVTNSTPPTLTNPQKVLLVAISLHRHYRVFPTDVQPATPPRPRQPKVATVATVAQPAPQPTTIHWTVVDEPPISNNPSLILPPRAIELLVADQIDRYATQRGIISSCKITVALRQVYPDGRILHEDVIRALSVQMTPLVAQQQYRVVPPLCNDKRHVWYMPV